ncbi:MAG TPA: redoxin domain-containing protein [Nitrospiraceae bacterium]|nr:redoxin domain-containing protein [Nitrospiraceae bacterium]
MTTAARCFRCGGLLVPDYDNEEYPRMPTLKCVNCGRTPPGGASRHSLSTPASQWSRPGSQGQGHQPLARVGRPAPQFRLAAVMNGEPTYLHSTRYHGRWVILCFPSLLGLVERMVLDRQSHLFARADTALLVVAPDDLVAGDPGTRTAGPVSVPLLIDPMKRLSRLYGVKHGAAAGRCHTFAIDPDNIVRFHHAHPLTVRSMEALRRRLSPRDLGTARRIVMSR